MRVTIFGSIRESSFVDGGSSKNRSPLNLVSRVSRGTSARFIKSETRLASYPRNTKESERGFRFRWSGLLFPLP